MVVHTIKAVPTTDPLITEDTRSLKYPKDNTDTSCTSEAIHLILRDHGIFTHVCYLYFKCDKLLSSTFNFLLLF